MRVRARPREILGVIAAEQRVAAGELPGVLDAAATALLLGRTGDPSLFVVEEPAPTWLSGPNRLLALTLLEAERSVLGHMKLVSGGPLALVVDERARLLEGALRVSALREILLAPAGRSRLTPHERRQAGKARATLYRLAYACAELLAGIEALNPDALASLLSTSLLPALEDWRRFELGCALQVASAVAAAVGMPVVLDAAFAPSRPVARIGNVSVWWQRSVQRRPHSELDLGESMARQAAESLGAFDGVGRIDVAVERADHLIAMVECKWFRSPEQASRAIQDACYQITAYARDTAWAAGCDPVLLVRNSLVALAHRNNAPLALGTGPIGCAGFEDIEEGALDEWAARILDPS